MKLKYFFEDVTGEIPTPKQEEFFNKIDNDLDDPFRIYLMAGRGCGKTFCLAIIALWYAIVISHFEKQAMGVACIAGSKNQSQRLFKYTDIFLNKNPKLKQFVKFYKIGGKAIWSKDKVEFKNGSSIEALAVSIPGTQGLHVPILLVDEAAQEKSDLSEEVLRSAEEIPAGKFHRRIIYASVPYDPDSPFVQDYEHKVPQSDKFHWSKMDCVREAEGGVEGGWFTRAEIADNKARLSEAKFKIYVEGLPARMQAGLFDLEKLKKCIVDPSKIHKTETGDVIAGVDWGDVAAQTALVIIEIDDLIENKIKVRVAETYSDPELDETIPKIIAKCLSEKVTLMVMDAIPGHACAMMERDLKFTVIKSRRQAFTKRLGISLYSNLKTIVEKVLIQIPRVYKGGRKSLVEQMRDMEWKKNTKKRTDLVDALALACSEFSSFIKFKRLGQRADVTKEMEALLKEKNRGDTIDILPKQEEEEKEPIKYPKALQGNPNDQIYFQDPTLGFMRIMSKEEARAIYRNTSLRSRRRKFSIRRSF